MFVVTAVWQKPVPLALPSPAEKQASCIHHKLARVAQLLPDTGRSPRERERRLNFRRCRTRILSRRGPETWSRAPRVLPTPAGCCLAL